jgi:hypothetical protein
MNIRRKNDLRKKTTPQSIPQTRSLLENWKILSHGGVDFVWKSLFIRPLKVVVDVNGDPHFYLIRGCL